MHFNLVSSYNMEVKSAYIIRLSNNSESVKLSDRCAKSCDAVGQKWKFFEGVDGTRDKMIFPDHLIDKDYMRWVKVVNSELTLSQLACVYSHFALWCHCLTIDQPIVVLEHDAIMEKPYVFHNFFNNIVYLGCIEQKAGGAKVYPIPPHGTHYNGLWHFVCRAHAYSIDPAVARNLVSHVISHGLYFSLDVMMRADLFGIVQEGLYAYDLRGVSTIKEHNVNK